jgi:hypothetical protein
VSAVHIIEWSAGELMSSFCYGELWLVTNIDRVMTCYRVRKRKGNLYISNDKKDYKVVHGPEVGNLLFVDKGGKVARLVSEGALKEQIDKALEKLT